jgi:hypothetical protein
VKEAKKSGYWESAYTNLTVELVPHDLKEALMKDTAAWDDFNKFAKVDVTFTFSGLIKEGLRKRDKKELKWSWSNH